MAKCMDCGEEMGIFGGTFGRCGSCHAAYSRRVAGQAASQADLMKAAEAALLETAKSILLTTETIMSGVEISQRLGIVSAECVFGMNLFKDLFAVGRDIFGGRSSAIQSTLKDARNTALDELKLEAARLGADAVIAVDLDYSEISGGGKSMLFIVATGTAVKLAP